MNFWRASAILAAPAFVLVGCATPQPRETWTTQQIAALRADNFVQTERGWEFTVDDRLLFRTDDASIDHEQQSILAAMAARLIAVGIGHAEVEGHTDSTGSHSHNDRLSQQRAEAVASAFLISGFAPGNVRSSGLGKRFPIESNATASGRRENRRVVVLITAP